VIQATVDTLVAGLAV